MNDKSNTYPFTHTSTHVPHTPTGHTSQSPSCEVNGTPHSIHHTPWAIYAHAHMHLHLHPMPPSVHTGTHCAHAPCTLHVHAALFTSPLTPSTMPPGVSMPMLALQVAPFAPSAPAFAPHAPPQSMLTTLVSTHPTPSAFVPPPFAPDLGTQMPDLTCSQSYCCCAQNW